MKFERSSGIILHPTSLPGKYGIGTLGKEAYFFINFLKATKQKLWQILPLGPTDSINCPYQNTSAFAGNPLLIDVDMLVEDGLLTNNDLDTVLSFTDTEANFALASEFKFPLLKKAYHNFKEQNYKEVVAAFDQFCSKNKSWLRDFSLFMALKEHFKLQAWNKWEPRIKNRLPEAVIQYKLLLKDEIQYHQFVQYLFYRQWNKLKKYANKAGVSIIGDIPIFISYDSADVWAKPELFQLDKDKTPKAVSGVPPDFFSKTGQLWGNPLYDWDNSRKKLFKYWCKRLKHLLKQVDIVRIDHFIGFTRYWAVPNGETTAVNGKWKNAPGMELLTYLKKRTAFNRILVEDLGEVTKDVVKLRDHFNLPGMRILQFAFGSDTNNPSLPHHHKPHSVVYTGTHDNDTLVGWHKKLNRNERKFIKNYLNCKETRINWDMIRLAWSSVAIFAITPLQDILSLGNEAKMNSPGTTDGNWKWRYESKQLTRKIKAELKKITSIYGR